MDLQEYVTTAFSLISFMIMTCPPKEKRVNTFIAALIVSLADLFVVRLE